MEKNEHKEVTHFNPSLKEGLSLEQVKAREKDNLTNVSKGVRGKSHLKIIFESYFNFFNIILFVVAIVFVICSFSFKDGVKYIPFTKYIFLLFILANGTISVISQELSKKKIEKMKLISDPRSKVLRNGKEESIYSKDIVLDDILILSSGNQISCDLEVLEGEIFVDESMLTGESDNILKTVGDTLYSGSYVASGNGKAKAIAVGETTYISNLERKIEKIKKKKSKLMVNIYQIIRIMVYFIIPIVLAVFVKTWFVGDGSGNWEFNVNVITKSAAVLVGMIPIGMILLSSVTLSKAILELSKMNTMIQELYAIENLSAVNTLCLDKTGTITTQNFDVSDAINLKNVEDFHDVVFTFFSSFKSLNETGKALKEHFNKGKLLEVVEISPFDSKKKSSSIVLKDGRVVTLGAPEFTFHKEENLKTAEAKAKEGFRVLGLKINDEEVALFLLKDELRKNIKETLDFFNKLNIDLKVISGDNPITVMQTCKNAGLQNCDKYISMENVKLEEIPEICEVYSIFGRTSPDQKQEIIKCLQAKGRVVGYIGDGVNDTQSLRQADCSIALKSGEDSTKAVSDVVLLDDDFGHLPSVLEVGRRVVSNIERSMLLFLTKGIFIGLFSFISVFIPGGLVIEIESMYVYEITIIGVAGTLLAFQKNQSKAQNTNFVSEVLLKSLVSGLFMTFTAYLPLLLSKFFDMSNYSYLIPIFITIAGVSILFDICKPFTKYTTIVFLLSTVLSVFLFILIPNFFCNPNCLKTAGGIGDQLELFSKSFFDFTIYKSMKTAEMISIIVYFALSYFVYFGIKHLVNFVYKVIGKSIKKAKSKSN